MTTYIVGAAIALVVAILLWLLWRRWLWDNIFGVCMVSSIGMHVGPLRLTIGDLVHLEMQDGPHWIVTVVLAVLHFATINARARRELAEALRRQAENEHRRRIEMEKFLDDLIAQGIDIGPLLGKDHHGNTGHNLTRFDIPQLPPRLAPRALLRVGPVILWR